MLGSHPNCYEVRVDAPGQKMAVVSLRCAAARPGKGDAVCSLVPIRQADNAISIDEGMLHSAHIISSIRLGLLDCQRILSPY